MIYVDPIQPCLKSKRWPYKTSCHLFCDPDTSLEELHEFAVSIGLKRNWFQDHTRLPHYDLTEYMRMKAILKGAVELNVEEAVRVLRKWKGV